MLSPNLIPLLRNRCNEHAGYVAQLWPTNSYWCKPICPLFLLATTDTQGLADASKAHASQQLVDTKTTK